MIIVPRCKQEYTVNHNECSVCKILFSLNYSTENDLTVFTCVLKQGGGERNSTFFLLVITECQRNASSQMLH